jgi:hypothetical protein
LDLLWVVRIILGLMLITGFFAVIFLLFPRTVKHYFLWKNDKNEKHLAEWLTGGGLVLLVLVTSFLISLQKISSWQSSLSDPSLVDSFAIVICYPLSTIFLAPRSVRYFRKWQASGKNSRLIISALLGTLALFLITAAFKLNLQSFLKTPFP